MRENPLINSIAKRIAEKCSPHKIILISYKTNNYSELTSFKLALIVDDSTESMPELECSLYMDIDSDIPFDLVFYLKDNEGTFAWKINNTGAVLYE
jgi:hypothetical protein